MEAMRDRVDLSVRTDSKETRIHKNLIIFSYKNHLDRFCINRKQFI
jgi:hypothetical protein